jgi:hypothetical protein
MVRPNSGKVLSLGKASVANDTPSSIAQTEENTLGNSYLSSLAASALDDTLEVAEPEQKY